MSFKMTIGHFFLPLEKTVMLACLLLGHYSRVPSEDTRGRLQRLARLFVAIGFNSCTVSCWTELKPNTFLKCLILWLSVGAVCFCYQFTMNLGIGWAKADLPMGKKAAFKMGQGQTLWFDAVGLQMLGHSSLHTTPCYLGDLEPEYTGLSQTGNITPSGVLGLYLAISQLFFAGQTQRQMFRLNLPIPYATLTEALSI